MALTDANQCARELHEAREQQTATSDVLRAISGAPIDAQSVFDAIVRKAVPLSGSLFANVFRFDGELLHWLASCNVDPSYDKGGSVPSLSFSSISSRTISGSPTVILA
jgi:hypothetical protein